MDLQVGEGILSLPAGIAAGTGIVAALLIMTAFYMVLGKKSHRKKQTTLERERHEFLTTNAECAELAAHRAHNPGDDVYLLVHRSVLPSHWNQEPWRGRHGRPR